jgi:heptosyltransferase-2
VRAIDPKKVRKLLIRGTNWVGDAVMSIPAMRAVRQVFPSAHISLLVRPWVRDVYSRVDFVDEVLEYDKQGKHRGWSGHCLLVQDLRKRQFDTAILLQNAFEAAFIACRARIPCRLGYARDGRGFLLSHAARIDPEVRTVHQAYYYLGLLAAAGLIESRPWRTGSWSLDIRIGVRDADREAAVRMLSHEGITPEQPLVGVNPGAYYGSAKRWLPERYARVADELAARYGVRILMFGSAGESALASEIAGRMAHTPALLAGRTTLGQLMALIERCALFITNDSGPMHLAAALGIPQVAIFGSTSDVATGPLSRDAEIIRVPADCSPCFLRECPTDLRCMTGITVEQVLASAERGLGKRLAGFARASRPESQH